MRIVTQRPASMAAAPTCTVRGQDTLPKLFRQVVKERGDQVVAVDIHIVMVPTPGGPQPVPLPHPFVGMLNNALSSDVKIMGKPAATVDSTADNTPAHIPTPPGVSFQKSPSNKATVTVGSSTPS
jgi:hypothetical protein